MSNLSEFRLLPPEYSAQNNDPNIPITNLSTIRSKMDSVHRFLSESVNSNTLISQHQMNLVSSEIASAIHQTIVNGAALLASSSSPQQPTSQLPPDSEHPEAGLVSEKTEQISEYESDCEIVEIDAAQLLAEHVHFCDICGKGFKRDANLRMHMRAHGNEFQTLEALAKSDKGIVSRRKKRFSCPFEGCNRNKKHRKFRALSSVICVKNHFKRSHCPKIYQCEKCHKKSFAVISDLKSHYKNCGDSRWRCSCGTSFSRKDKLFGHVALFEGHMPDVRLEEKMNDDADADHDADHDHDDDEMDDGLLFEGLLDNFGSLDNFCLQDVLGSCSSGGGVL